MIIAAYAGCGKTVFASKTWNSIDFVCVPHKYVVPEVSCGDEDPVDEYQDKNSLVEEESKKACYGYPLNPAWPQNYISAVITAYHRYQYVVIPTVLSVLNALKRFRIPYILCYPERSAREEYRRRYRERGNGEDFESVFIDQWDINIARLEEDDYGKHLVLRKDEYLLDHQKFLEAYAEEKETVIQFDLDQDMQEIAKKAFEETGVCVEEQLRQWIIWTNENQDALKCWEEKGGVAIPKEYVNLDEMLTD